MQVYETPLLLLARGGPTNPHRTTNPRQSRQFSSYHESAAIATILAKFGVEGDESRGIFGRRFGVEGDENRGILAKNLVLSGAR